MMVLFIVLQLVIGLQVLIGISEILHYEKDCSNYNI